MCVKCKSLVSLSRRSILKAALAIGASTTLAGLERLLDPPVVAATIEPTIITCSEWGAELPAQNIQVLLSRPRMIVIHHTAGPNTSDYSKAHAIELARNIQYDHIHNNGWIDTGQHYTVSRGGIILQGRHLSLGALRKGDRHVLGAHCEGQNHLAVGIENEGNYTSHKPPEALYLRLVELCTYICLRYGISPKAIYSHRRFFKTACPGDQLYQMLPELRKDVAAGLRARANLG